ncbi:hypothetical protein [Clostridium coskatii]|uniref:RNA polymerase sigma factor n=1 Tax=Clostridium coskatii TaxID=1705578 RepID=A0A162L5A9_9CLOT|nr:hypothetical protein [Clostridium coskatii]OAA91322.1 hypothetical protein WX73_01732 [Clostridium coskatii]OBR93954.1 hypothetical protein CLCOS_20900 [Clostridium coskatii]
MNKFSTDQENFISKYKSFKAAVKNIDLDIDEYNECSESIENVKRLEELKQNYVKKINIIDLFLDSLSEADRRIVILKYIERKTSKFIAKEFNIIPQKIIYKVSLIKKLILKLECE